MILVLLGTTIMLGINTEDNADLAFLHSQTLSLRAISDQDRTNPVVQAFADQRSFHQYPEIMLQAGPSVIALGCVLRC